MGVINCPRRNINGGESKGMDEILRHFMPLSQLHHIKDSKFGTIVCGYRVHAG